jgi:hypothetical protein
LPVDVAQQPARQLLRILTFFVHLYTDKMMSSCCRLIVPLLVAVIMAWMALAYASPPDPSYIGGFWDDGDYDDVVILATSANAIVDVRPGFDFAATRLILLAPPPRDPLISSRWFCPLAPRAPPSA